MFSTRTRSTISLPPTELLTVTADANSAGYVVRLGDQAGQQPQGVTNVPASSSQTFGPFTDTARFDIACNFGILNYSLSPSDLTSLNQTAGTVEISADYAGARSFQPIAADLNLDAGAGKSAAGDSAFLAPIMGNLNGDALTKTHNYLGGVIGADSVTGTKASLLQKAPVIGIVMDGVSEADAAVCAIIDGSDPSSVTRANAAFAARMNNNNAGSGVDYGVDLYDAGRDSTLYTGGGRALAIAKAIIRTPGQVCILEGAGVPVDGTTGDNFAAGGSLYIDVTNHEAYINTGTITDSVWKKITHA